MSAPGRPVATHPIALSCRTCGEEPRPWDGDGVDGELRCRCRSFVTVAGVVDTAPSSRLLAASRRGPAAARRVFLGRQWARVRAAEITGTPTYRRFLRHGVLARLATTDRIGSALDRSAAHPWLRPFWGAAQWHLYMRHRFATPSFFAASAALGLVRDRPGLVLDAPCGMGHLAHRLSGLVEPGRIVALDLDAPSAYATRRFLAPDVGAVLRADLDQLLPLPDRSVGVAFCVDAFHYVGRKQQLAQEFLRVLDDDGVLAVLHLHNRLQENPTPGTPLSPREYAELFPGCTVRAVPEDDLLAARLHGEPLDLSVPVPAERLDAAPALALFVARHPDALGRVEPVPAGRTEGQRPLALAEVYRRDGAEPVLRRRIPPTLAGEYPEMERILPEQVALAADPDVARLLELGVLVDLPEAY